MFESLSQRLSNILQKFTGGGVLNTEQINNSMAEVRRALIEADVALPVVDEFISKVTVLAEGQKIIRSVTPHQMMIKIIYDALVDLLGQHADEHWLPQTSSGLSVVMMVGLQGSGKTTSTAKLGLYLKKQQRRVLLASTDIYRPAAQQQLQKLAQDIAIDSLPIHEAELVLEIAQRALQIAKQQGYDTLIIDTAGRLQIDQPMINELQQLEKLVTPRETILVVDALTGQDAVNIASGFSKSINLSGLVLTRIDGDARGGAALSMKYITGKPIKFLGTGEKADSLEVFRPERLASRILGMGDVVSLVEQAAEQLDIEEAKRAEAKLQSGQFSLDDYLAQLRQIKKLGGFKGILNFLPNMFKAKAEQKSVDDKVFNVQQAIIQSMTREERRNPDIIRHSRKQRIASGSGTSVQEVNVLLKQYQQLQTMIKKLSRMDTKNIESSDFFRSMFRK